MTATIKTTNLQHASSGSANIVLASDGSTTIADGTITAVTTASLNGGQLAGFRNRIINGNGVIDQRGPVGGLGSYGPDRWKTFGVGSGSFTIYVNGGYVEAYVGVSDASPLASGDYYGVQQYIEANNISDFLLGTASAKTVTLSFTHKHTKAGTYTVALRNAAANRSYLAEYTQSVANTEETATVTVPLDTTGTWATGTSIGLDVSWAVGAGGSFMGSTGSWLAGGYIASGNQTNAMDTVGNALRIKDVQLEIGSDATPFEQRSIGTELALCQRYLPAYNAESASAETIALGQNYTTTNAMMVFPFVVEPRVKPTGISISAAGNFRVTAANAAGIVVTGLAFSNASRKAAQINATVGSGLVAGNATRFYSLAATAQILFTGCEL